MTPTLAVWHSNIFTQSLITELTLNPGWHDWWPLSTHLTWGDIWVMGLSLRITVSHVCHDPSVVISCLMLIIQIIFSLQQSLQLKCKVNVLQMSLPSFWATYFAELWQIYHNRHSLCCGYSPPSFPACTACIADVLTLTHSALLAPHCAVSRHWLTLARRNITHNMTNTWAGAGGIKSK